MASTTQHSSAASTTSATIRTAEEHTTTSCSSTRSLQASLGASSSDYNVFSPPACWRYVQAFLTWLCTGLTSGPTRLWKFMFVRPLQGFLNQYNVENPISGTILKVKAVDETSDDRNEIWYGITYRYYHGISWYERSCHYVKIPRRDGEPHPDYLRPSQPIELVMITACPSSAFPLESLIAMKQQEEEKCDVFEFIFHPIQFWVDGAVEYVFVIAWWLPIITLALGFIVGAPVHHWVGAYVFETFIMVFGLLYCYYRHARLILQMKGSGQVLPDDMKAVDDGDTSTIDLCDNYLASSNNSNASSTLDLSDERKLPARPVMINVV